MNQTLGIILIFSFPGPSQNLMSDDLMLSGHCSIACGQGLDVFVRAKYVLLVQPPEVTTVGDDVPLLMEEESQDVNNLRDTYHELKTQLQTLISEVSHFTSVI